jgi:hypothetical protein
MTNRKLSTYFNLHRRYFRSVNLERDLDIPDAVLGYVPTERSIDALRRIITAFDRPNAHRYWTMTGVYGTGKSSFAHYLACLCAPANSETRQNALNIAEKSFGKDNSDLIAIRETIPEKGLFRAIATAQREPLSWTIVRALANGANLLWTKGKKAKIATELIDLVSQIDDGNKSILISSTTVLSLLKQTIESIDTDLLLVIDELGKSLEFASMQQGSEDLYLLQQIAEIKIKGSKQIYFLGMLHQSFAGYSSGLTTVEQNEWVKIQGRFEDIPLTESPNQMTRLIGQAIDLTNADPILYPIHQQAEEWFNTLQSILTENEVSTNIIAAAYPLHPLTSLILPLLCVRYAQNDRSLFTFLTSDEPYAFRQFLESEIVEGDKISTLKLHRVYDYFVESVTGLTSRINLQRWVEIQTLIQDVGNQPPEILRLLKTIGVMNLVTATGSLRASPELVTLAMCDRSYDSAELEFWQEQIELLKTKGLITYRTQGNELRIWEGSDFNVDLAIRDIADRDRFTLASLLQQLRPLKPLVAQRHYTTTGSLRYFERQYVDSRVQLPEVKCSSDSYDGLIIYWLDSSLPTVFPTATIDNKPLIIVQISQLSTLQIRCQEFSALHKIQTTAAELVNDGVARKEVKHRLVEAERLLDETIDRAFDWADGKNICWVEGEIVEIERTKAFQSLLSTICDRVYSQGLKLDNELINRRELTSQGSKARRELIEGCIEHSDLPRLGLEGYGPEVTIYHSVFGATRIHRQENDEWGFYPPDLSTTAGRGINDVWQAIENFCLAAKERQQSLDLLYRQLEKPPYGIKQGIIPLLIAAVLIHRIDDVSFYKDGIFVPILSSEHFELLVKDPSRYSVKYIEVIGLRAQVFKELESVLRSSVQGQSTSIRNSTLLSVVKPLFQFEKRLPAYTKKTQRMSERARIVLKSFGDAQEPDVLIFSTLPIACGLPPVGSESQASDNPENIDLPRELRIRLVQVLQEIQSAYENLLIECKSLLHSAFAVSSGENKLREDLRVRASYLVGNCVDPLLRRFTIAAVEESKSDRDWLEALVSIVADKPTTSWTDQDVTSFEVKLSDLSRRFNNLEALQKEVVTSNRSGFEASRITITQADGREVNRMVWIDREQSGKVDELVDELVERINGYDDIQLQQAIVAKLAERLFGAQIPGHNTIELSDRSGGGNVGKGSKTHSRSIRG